MTPEDQKDFALPIGIASGGAMYQCLAIVAALAEARLVDPMKVVAWAEMFADGQGATLAPEIRAGIAEHLKNFAAVVRAMATKPTEQKVPS